jgi:hypothetical protein
MGMALLLGLAASATAGGGGVAWDSPEAALQKAALTGKPICYSFIQNEATREGST